MRLFYVVKTMQMINSFVIIALFLGTLHLCGKTSLDRALSHPNSSCMQFVQKLNLKNALLSKEKNGGNKIVVSNKYLENKTAKVYNNENNIANSNFDEMITFNEIFESYSCMTVDFHDPNCFVWINSDNKLPCQAIFGMTFPIFIVVLDFLHLLYTMISFSFRIIQSSKKSDFVRCVIHIVLWFIASIATMYIIYTWEHAWRYVDFKAEIPKQTYLAMIFSAINVVVYCAEIFYGKWLYLRIRMLIKADKTKKSNELSLKWYKRARSGKELDSEIAIAESTETTAVIHPVKDFKSEENLLITTNEDI